MFFYCKFIPETAVKNLSKIFPFMFNTTLSIFIRTKNHLNMEMPIDSFIIIIIIYSHSWLFSLLCVFCEDHDWTHIDSYALMLDSFCSVAYIQSSSLQSWHLKSTFEVQQVSLTRFWQIFPFYAPWKHQKTKGFLVFSGGIKLEHWS